MKPLRVFVFLVLALSVSRAADATPITIDAGIPVIFNFDLTGKLVPAPFDLVDIVMNIFPQIDASDAGAFKLFSEFNGVGDTGDSFFRPAFESTAPGVLDGVFSVGVTLTSGSITADPLAQGFTFNSGGTPLSPPVSVVVTPEPATWTLLSLGLAGAGARRWRRRRRFDPQCRE